MAPAHDDVIDGGPPDGPTRRWGAVPAGIAGLVVGGVLGSVLTVELRTQDPGAARASAELGVPRRSLGQVVVPVEVVNVGAGSVTVEGLRLADGAPDSTAPDITLDLVEDGVLVPPGELREALVRVGRDCPAEESFPRDVEPVVVLRAGDDVTTQAVRVSAASSRLLAFLLSCDDA